MAASKGGCMKKYRATILALSLVTAFAFIGSNAPRVYADGGGQGGGDSKQKPKPKPLPLEEDVISEVESSDSEYSSLNIIYDNMLIVLDILY